MATAQQMSKEAEQKVADIVRQDLRNGFADRIVVNHVHVTLAEDQFGEPYHRIQVIYNGHGRLLDATWLNGFKRRNQDQLAEYGVYMTSESYSERTIDQQNIQSPAVIPSEENKG